MLFNLVENTVGKGEIAHYKQFLFSHSVFKRLVSQGCQKVSLCGKGLKLDKMLEFVLDGFENIRGKGENACNQHFLL